MPSVHFTANFEALLQMKAYQEFFFTYLLPLDGELDGEWGSLVEKYREKMGLYCQMLLEILEEMGLTAQVKKVIVDLNTRSLPPVASFYSLILSTLKWVS